MELDGATTTWLNLFHKALSESWCADAALLHGNRSDRDGTFNDMTNYRINSESRWISVWWFTKREKYSCRQRKGRSCKPLTRRIGSRTGAYSESTAAWRKHSPDCFFTGRSTPHNARSQDVVSVTIEVDFLVIITAQHLHLKTYINVQGERLHPELGFQLCRFKGQIVNVSGLWEVTAVTSPSGGTSRIRVPPSGPRKRGPWYHHL